jgi:hypothetical protein
MVYIDSDFPKKNIRILAIIIDDIKSKTSDLRIKNQPGQKPEPMN